MQSSLLVTLRSFVMLVCMVAVPAIAVLGTSWGAGLRKLLGDATRPMAAAPISLRASGESPGAQVAPLFPGPAAPIQPLVDGEVPPQPLGPAANAWPIDSTHNAPANYLQPVASADEPWGRVPGGSGHPSAPAAMAPAHAASLAPTPAAGDALQAVMGQLRHLGATYVLLETWGQQGDLFRFQCKVALSDNPHFTRHFEATDPSALAAMQRVLAEVAAWKQPVAR